MGNYVWKIASGPVPGHEYRIPIDFFAPIYAEKKGVPGGSDLMQKLDAISLYPKSDINKYPYLIHTVRTVCVWLNFSEFAKYFYDLA